MIGERDSRTAKLLGEEAVAVLNGKHVAVFGIGGVGGFVCEGLSRAGIGALDLVDSDVVSPSNLNRQLIALTSTVGRKKTEVMAQRIRDIRPETAVRTFDLFYLPETADRIDLSAYDYIVDAIDTVAGKIALAEGAKRAGVPLIAAMGAGNRLDPTRFRVTDLFKTSGCPLARVMRRELKKRGIEELKVVFSDEPAMKPLERPEDEGSNKRAVPVSVSFVPSVMGLILAGEVVKDLLRSEGLLEGK